MSNILIEPVKKNYIFGDKVSINVSTKLKNGEIAKIQLYYNNQLIKETKELDFSVSDIILNAVGNVNFKVIASKTDGIENNKIKSLLVVSDIVPEKYSFQIINEYPHSINSYTQGLEYYKGFLYEGTGIEGKSSLYKVNIQTGNPIQTFRLKNNVFGEGITILNNKIYQITWKNHIGFVYNLTDFAPIDSFSLKQAEGWGLTNDGKNLIISDGSHNLTWLDSNNFSVIKSIQVANNLNVTNNLNELEFVDGTIYSNVYTTDIIIQIEAETGRILKEINLKGLIDKFKSQYESIEVLNGIAYDSDNKRLFVTGKNWPRLFEIKLVPLK